MDNQEINSSVTQDNGLLRIPIRWVLTIGSTQFLNHIFALVECDGTSIVFRGAWLKFHIRSWQLSDAKNITCNDNRTKWKFDFNTNLVTFRTNEADGQALYEKIFSKQNQLASNVRDIDDVSVG